MTGPTLDQDLGGWCGSSGGAALTETWSAAIPAGRLVTVVAGYWGGATGSVGLAFSDSKGNTWTKLVDSGAAPGGAQTAFFASQITTAMSTSDSFTLSWAAGTSVNYLSVTVASWTGVTIVGAYATAATAAGNGGSSTPGNVTSSAPIRAGDLAVAGNWNGQTVAGSFGSGWTTFARNNSPAIKEVGSYQVPTSAGTVTFSNEQSSTEGCAIAAFKAFSGALTMLV